MCTSNSSIPTTPWGWPPSSSAYAVRVGGYRQSANFDDGHAVYELANEIHHDHMVDVDNGAVIEFISDEIENYNTRSPSSTATI
ncbi:MAG: hypothetical protein CM15mP120_17390 [Pseudomonadota bacterium]|nr:MAG: hypothetical protein CM15mP120_17390 [Pseudomonadota bacterium]